MMMKRHGTPASLLAALFMFMLGGCANLPPAAPFSPFSAGETSELSRDERKRQRRINRAWHRVTDHTDIMRVTPDRIRIESKTSPFVGIDEAETSFLIRAAAETLRGGYDGFVIRYLDYRTEFPMNLTGGIPNFSENIEITAYEDFLDYSKDQTLFTSTIGKSFKWLDGVIIMVNGDDSSVREYFPARELYETMLFRENG